jgi:hypothetical protein
VQSFGHRRTRSSKQATADKHHAARQGEQRCRAGTFIMLVSYVVPGATTAVMLAAPMIRWCRSHVPGSCTHLQHGSRSECLRSTTCITQHACWCCRLCLCPPAALGGWHT